MQAAVLLSLLRQAAVLLSLLRQREQGRQVQRAPPVARRQFSMEEKAELKALAKQKAEQKADLQRRPKTEELLQQVHRVPNP